MASSLIMILSTILLLLLPLLASSISTPTAAESTPVFESLNLNYVDMLGRYEVMRSDDFEKGISKTYSLFMDLRTNKSFNVHPSSLHSFSNIKSGTHVRVRGSIVDQMEAGGIVTHGVIHVRSFDEVKLGTTRDDNSASSLKRMVMLLINLGKYDLECTPTFMKSVVMGPDGWYGGLIGLTERNTMSAVTFSSDLHNDGMVDIFGPFYVKYEGTCDADVWANAAMNAARAQGIDISAYQNRVFVLPGVSELYSTCGWHGLGNVNCDVCNAWVADCATVEVFLHELGHNLGLSHAGSNWNQKGNLVEYGDPTSVMGNGWWETTKDVTWYNLIEMEYLMQGAINVTKVTESGQYIIASFDLPPVNVIYAQGIKVLHPENGHYFYFSFHSNTSVVLGGQILVHEYQGMSSPCYIIQSLPLGETFIDKLNKISVTTVAYNNDSSTYVLQVDFGCVTRPTDYNVVLHTKVGEDFTISTTGALPFAAGDSASFTLQIFNWDSPLCAPTFYNFEADQGDWSSTFSPSSLFLVPGQNCSVELSVLFSKQLDNGNYPIQVSATSDSGFPSPDHDFGFLLNTTIGPLECVFNPPTVVLSAGNLYKEAKTIYYTLEIWNNDGFGCNMTQFIVDVNMTRNYTWDHRNKDVPVYPGRMESSQLQFTYVHESYFFRNITVTISAPNHPDTIVWSVLPMSTVDSCTRHTPLLQVLDPTLSMSTRAAESVLVSITNRDTPSCVSGSTFQFTVLNSPPARFSLYPASMFLLPGQVAYFYLIVAMPIFEYQFVNKSVVVGADRWLDGSYYDSTSYLSLSVTPPPCERGNLGYASWCQNDGDLAAGWIQCAGLIHNDDSWNCPYLEMNVQALVPPGWHADFQQGNLMTYNPGNSTWYWVNMTVPSDIQPGGYTYHFYGNEIGANDTSHSFNDSYTVYTCSKVPLDLSSASPQPGPIAQGMSAKYPLRVWNGNSVFCVNLNVLMAAELEKAAIGLLSVSFSQPSFTLGHQSDSVVQVTITANLTGIRPLNSFDNFRTFSINLTATDKTNATFYKAIMPMNITVLLNCTLNVPNITITPVPYQPMIPGIGRSATYTVSITNTDTPLCSGTSFSGSFSAPTNFRTPSSVKSYLNPSETYVTNVTYDIDDNTPPGVFNVIATITDDQSRRHTTNAMANYTISCPEPRPIFNLSAQQFTPFLRTKTAVQLSWNACENPIWCCCPCTWEIYRDGKKVGESSGSNFTDLDRPAGSHNVYTAVTIDNRGVRSPNTTCIVYVQVRVQSPDLMKLYYFIAIVIGAAIWLFGCFVLIFMVRRRYKRPRAALLEEESLLRADEEKETEMDMEVDVEANKRMAAWTEEVSIASGSEDGMSDKEDAVVAKSEDKKESKVTVKVDSSAETKPEHKDEITEEESF